MVAAYIPGPNGPIVISSTAGGGGGTTTLNPSAKSANITLSGGNLIATGGASAGVGTDALSVASHSSGKYYCEFTATTVSGSNGAMGCGIADSSWTFDSTWAGNAAHSAAAYGSGNVYINGVGNPITTTGWAQGDVVCMAVDIGNLTIWWRKNNGVWNAGGGADPATNTGGGTIAGMSTPFFALVEIEANTNVWTANFGGSAYAQTPPSGFGNW